MKILNLHLHIIRMNKMVIRRLLLMSHFFRLSMKCHLFWILLDYPAKLDEGGSIEETLKKNKAHYPSELSLPIPKLQARTGEKETT